MNNTTQYIKQRLSLRDPLQDSLDIVAQIAGRLSLQKEIDVDKELQTVKALFPTCTDFERAFPSLTFAIATGVGKTRLMGACIAYLYLAKGIKNFFILAPGSTIYEKLIEDFGNPAFHKYVFKGISEFVHNPPVIITGDNYGQQGALFEESEIRINIFNIQKFNRDTKAITRGKEKGKAPKIKRLSEYLGQSYWNYLSSLEDLVILMDESHRYHGDASKKALNELQPILGLEMTATPIGKDDKVFKNIVYEYNLAQALEDGKYVKIPTIATRKNFDPKKHNQQEIELIKLEDAISIHEKTREHLRLYSENNGAKLVKPFILVVCKDINHASDIYKKINQADFYDGLYKDKVLQIDSSTRSTEDIERQFLSLEQPDNEIEIVIHVNMLKEGWDVTNLYTIVPLRAAKAPVLIEQTIGRGLRLPFGGKRTGDDDVDKLTVIAHDNFEKVIDAAQDPNSILNKLSFVEIEADDLKEKTEVVKSVPIIEKQFETEQASVNQIKEPKKKQVAQNVLDAKKAIIDVLPTLSNIRGVNKIEDLQKKEVEEQAIKRIEKNLAKAHQQNLFKDQIVRDAKKIYKKIVSEYKKNIIEIPRMTITQGEVIATFKAFDLDTTGLNYKALQEEIIRVNLKDDKDVETINARPSGAYGDPKKLLISELINFPEIDYDDNADLLYGLAEQALKALRSSIADPKELSLTVYQFKSTIAEKIYQQMKEHFDLSVPDYDIPNIRAFIKIEPWSFSALLNEGYQDYRQLIQPISRIPKYVFSGFEKACHFEYKFDSKAEQDLAYVLENDKTVLKWLRPAPNQFRMYWDNNSKRYEPDFIVEVEETIYMVEVKRSDQLEALDVQAKKKSALHYCHHASNFTKKNGGKEWKYVLIPHNAISRSSSVPYLAENYTS